ncbi:MAG: DUF4293 family protein [Saprospiraceae bacterium]|nr:DUF4293 family protein [Saprospiraceae bacterium]
MIQRIQSLFLLLSSGSLGSLFINSISFADFTEPNPSVPASADGFLNIYDDKILLGVTAFVILLCFIAISLYKNRPNQIRMSWAMIASSIVLIVLASLQIQKIGALVALKMTGIGFIPIALAMIFGFLAIRYIRKDELLVRSADRLR